jgi:hypothetical protein
LRHGQRPAIILANSVAGCFKFWAEEKRGTTSMLMFISAGAFPNYKVHNLESHHTNLAPATFYPSDIRKHAVSLQHAVLRTGGNSSSATAIDRGD